jgi:hypothetical protein
MDFEILEGKWALVTAHTLRPPADGVRGLIVGSKSDNVAYTKVAGYVHDRDASMRRQGRYHPEIEEGLIGQG